MFEFIKNLFSDKNSIRVTGNNNVVSNTTIVNGRVSHTMTHHGKNSHEPQQHDTALPELCSYPLPLSDTLICDLVGRVNIIIDPQAQPTVTMNATPFLHEAFQYKTSNLSFGFSNSSIINDKLIVNNVSTSLPDITIRVPSLTTLRLTGLADYHAQLEPSSTLNLYKDGIGHAELYIQSDTLTLHNEGLGNINVFGTSVYGDIKQDGIGNLNMLKCIIQNGKLRSSGIGKTKAIIQEVHYVESSGIGNVTLYAETIHRNTQTGIGKVKHKPFSNTPTWGL